MLIEAARGGHTAVACLLLKQAIGVPPPQGEISTAGVPSLQQQALLQASQAGLLGGVSSMMHSLAPPIENQNWDQAKLEMRSEATSGPMVSLTLPYTIYVLYCAVMWCVWLLLGMMWCDVV